jgi:hypothetical protein
MVDDGRLRDPDEAPGINDLVQAAPGLARLAAGVWWRTASWSLVNSARAGSRVVRAAASGESAGQLLSELEMSGREYAQRVLGLVERGHEAEAGNAEPHEAAAEPPAPGRSDHGATTRSLRERGAALLRRSADVDYEEAAHPAYERILGELAPDEGRILRFLYLNGPQPSVDVRGHKGLNVHSQLVAPGINMVGAEAGCRYLERVPAYMNNLYRLGLLWFSREALEDRLRYQVLEAQPEVTTAMHAGGRGKTIRRSIHLTPFGEDFCRVCLPLNTAELETLPGPS